MGDRPRFSILDFDSKGEWGTDPRFSRNRDRQSKLGKAVAMRSFNLLRYHPLGGWPTASGMVCRLGVHGVGHLHSDAPLVP